jgi:hypothetical protein
MNKDSEHFFGKSEVFYHFDKGLRVGTRLFFDALLSFRSPSAFATAT